MRYRAQDPERAAAVLSALSQAYVQKHMALQRPSGEAEFFEQQTSEYEKKLHQSETQLVQFTLGGAWRPPALERDIALQKLGEADAAYRQIDQERVETERRMGALRAQLEVASLPLGHGETLGGQSPTARES